MMDATQLALEQRAAEEQRHHSKGQFLWVWAALLIMTGIDSLAGLPEHGTGPDAVDPDGPFPPESRTHHRLLHAPEV